MVWKAKVSYFELDSTKEKKIKTSETDHILLKSHWNDQLPKYSDE